MKTIVISSQKGGGGKTTLTALLSVEAERAGDGPAWLIDTDQQGTLSQWHERREAEKPERAEVPFAELGSSLPTIGKQHGGAFCFIDTAPTISDQTAAIIALADLVLIPVQPSPLDAWAIGDPLCLLPASSAFFSSAASAGSSNDLTAASAAGPTFPLFAKAVVASSY